MTARTPVRASLACATGYAVLLDPAQAPGRVWQDDVMTEVDTTGAWLSREDLDNARDRLPILYVDAIPVRVDDRGVVTHVGLLLRADSDGGIGQEVVGGRVLYHERIRDALLRHVENDLGPMALPRIPLSPQPFTVAEFFPTPGVTPFHDPRQHAVSLAFVVAVMGDCRPQQDALDLVLGHARRRPRLDRGRGEMTGWPRGARAPGPGPRRLSRSDRPRPVEWPHPP